MDQDRIQDKIKQEYSKLSKNSKLNITKKDFKTSLLNKNKNRYDDVLANEDTRVRLNDLKNDYINANHIKYNNTNYNINIISTQAPLPHTIRDFWKMVWDQKTSVIVMLTDFIENNTIKSDKYWENQEIVYLPEETINNTYIKLLISCDTYEKNNQSSDSYQSSSEELSNSNQDNYFINEITITDGNETRIIHHIQYIKWGDNKIPTSCEDIKSIIRLLDIDDNIIVHCSASIGRTGTFIACYILYVLRTNINNIKDEGIIYDIVSQLRTCREGMVQTRNQYKFLYTFLSYLIT